MDLLARILCKLVLMGLALFHIVLALMACSSISLLLLVLLPILEPIMEGHLSMLLVLTSHLNLSKPMLVLVTKSIPSV